MTDENSRSVSCSSCGTSLPTEWSQETKPENLCPNCGSNAKLVSMSFESKVDLRSSLRAKLKDPTLPSRKNPRVDVFSGDDLRKSDGQWMKKERILDRVNDQYKEVVIDPKTGEIIHHNEEPLSNHLGHGSDKPKP